MQTKSLTVEAMDEAGTGLARIASLSAVDHDGDTYEPGAFSWKEGGEQWAPLLTAHNRHEIPFGKCRVFERGDDVLAEIKINLNTQAGREWHAALRMDLEHGRPVQEWSYGYEAKDFVYALRGGVKVRVIRQSDVHEVSPVVRAAGLDTATLAVKSAKEQGDAFDRVIVDLTVIASAIETKSALPGETGLGKLREIKARIDGCLAALDAPGDDAPPEADEIANHAYAMHMLGRVQRHFG